MPGTERPEPALGLSRLWNHLLDISQPFLPPAGPAGAGQPESLK
jgi:hypothetical protein